jgi:hypothetical protein
MADETTDFPKTDDELRMIYGEGAVISRIGKFVIIHLDSPTPEMVANREADFDPEEFLLDDCPLCQMTREHGGHIVYDGASDAETDDAPEEGDVPEDLS